MYCSILKLLSGLENLQKVVINNKLDIDYDQLCSLYFGVERDMKLKYINLLPLSQKKIFEN